MDSGHKIRVASYNIHSCIGTDNIRNVERVIAVINQLNADIVALQEVRSTNSLSGDEDQLNYIAKHTSYYATPGPTITDMDTTYGNVLLTRNPPMTMVPVDISCPDYEPRGAILAKVACGKHLVVVCATHLGLKRKERRKQIALLFAAFEKSKLIPDILLGDFNEWWPWSKNIRILSGLFDTYNRIASFPSYLPVFAIDRIFTKHSLSLSKNQVFDIAMAKKASDHLPVHATLDMNELPIIKT